MKMSETDRDRISGAIWVWMGNLENEPGWKEWRRKRFAQTLYFDDPFSLKVQSVDGDLFSLTKSKSSMLLLSNTLACSRR